MQNTNGNTKSATTTTTLSNESGAAATKEERARRRRALHDLGVPNFNTFLVQQQQQAAAATGNDATATATTVLQRKPPKVLQLNIGLYCNQACGHCHVESSPLRTESMTAETAAQCLHLLQQTPSSSSITTLDITGGAPELNTNFRYIVQTARMLQPHLEIIDRCNLTVLQEPGQEDLIDFLKQHKVRIVASLPCYSAENVNQQRGNGVFERSIAALLALNEAGYGTPTTNDDDENLILDLVYNPAGAFLPPSQDKLEQQYKQQLYDNFGIVFNNLFTMTNMPIKRFADYLHRQGKLQEYMDLLVQNFNWDTTHNLMCLDTVSVNYDGKIFDCDFNQQLGYEIMADNNKNDDDDDDCGGGSGTGGGGGKKSGLSVFDLNSFADLQDYRIRTDNHCFGCTAGMGSS